MENKASITPSSNLKSRWHIKIGLRTGNRQLARESARWRDAAPECLEFRSDFTSHLYPCRPMADLFLPSPHLRIKMAQARPEPRRISEYHRPRRADRVPQL
jgi:hypothetical protein